MTDDNLVDAYREAMGDYEAANAGTGNRVEDHRVQLSPAYGRESVITVGDTP